MAGAATENRWFWIRVTAVALILAVFFVVWRFTSFADYLDPERAAAAAREVNQAAGQSPWAPLVAILVFIVAGVVVFPVSILIVADALVFGPWLGAAYSLIGSLASAAIVYPIGAWLGRDQIARLAGGRVHAVSKKMGEQGIVAVATLRVVPVAPYTVINLVMGASHVRFGDFLLGTLLGMGPGVVAMSVFGRQLKEAVVNPTPTSVAVLAGIFLAIVSLAALAQRLIGRRLGRNRSA